MTDDSEFNPDEDFFITRKGIFLKILMHKRLVNYLMLKPTKPYTCVSKIKYGDIIEGIWYKLGMTSIPGGDFRVSKSSVRHIKGSLHCLNTAFTGYLKNVRTTYKSCTHICNAR